MSATSSDELVFNLVHGFGQHDFNEFLNWAAKNKASDLSIQSGDYIFSQIRRVWRPVTTRKLEGPEVEQIIAMYYGASGPGALNKGEPLDFRLEAVLDRDTVLAFRANAVRCRVGEVANAISMTCRSIPEEPPPLESLGLEPEIMANLFPRYGLILVIGTTGSGKSTLMSAVNRYRLEHRLHDPVRIISYEDPVEYTFMRLGERYMPKVSQTEIGRGGGIGSFSEAGKNAMRRKADVIIMGEMRDRESVEAGFEMAMTGHCVMATLHVDTPAQVVDRMVSFFPVDGQPAAANKLRANLKLVIAQKLVRTTDDGVLAVRSWQVFDRKVNDALSREPYHKWESALRHIAQERGTDFESRAYPAFKSGRLDFEHFREVTGLTDAEVLDYVGACESFGADEALAFCANRGFDGSPLG